MDVILLFMKLEDKYWGIFLVALFFLYLLWTEKKTEAGATKKALFLAVYGLASYLVFLCPLTYKAVLRFAPSLADYYPLSHIQLAVPVMVLAGATALLLAAKEGKKRAAGLLIGFALLLAAAGDFAYLEPAPSSWSAVSEREEAEVFDMMLAHAKENGEEGKLRIWGMEPLMAKSRIYDAAFQPLYGKDIAQNPGKYSQELQLMYQNYASYDNENVTSINIGDQMDAIAGFPHLYPETDCDYLILYVPKYHYADYEEFFGEKGFNVKKRVCPLGYESVGKTEHLLVFYRQKG